MMFDDTGVIRVDGAFSTAAASVMSDLIWRTLGWNFGFDRQDPGTWGDFLITFPDASSRVLPHDGWHQDWGFAVDCDPVRWIKAFAFLNEVGPGGGGTLVVTGSHRLADHFGIKRPKSTASGCGSRN